MADITGLLAQLRGKEPPAVPFDPAAARRARAAKDGQAEPSGARTEPSGARTEPSGARTEPPGDGPSRRTAPT
jgi:hypothetical protein